MKFLNLVAFLFLTGLTSAYSQTHTIPLIRSGEVITEGKILYDSGKYEDAISKYLTVPRRDTNYVYMLSELALAYIANSKYDKAIEVCNEALQKVSIYKSHLLRSRAIATDRKGNFDESIKLFEEAIRAYPFDHTLYFNLGVTYYNHKDYDKAEDCFFQAVTIDPFHTTSHLNLANLAISKGRRTHAMLAMAIYLSLRNSDNSRLVTLNKFLGNELSEEDLVSSSRVNSCERLDQIIKSKIAMDKQFDSKIPLEAPVVRQYELFFSQLGLIQVDKNDRYVGYYLPFYKSVSEKGHSQTMIYHILGSTPNESIKKWLKKNSKQLSSFYDLANIELKKHRVEIAAPDVFGFKGLVQAWYNKNNQLEALGKQSGETKQGKWYYFHNNHEWAAEGDYDQNGDKRGVWKYYYENGNIKSEENYDTGEIKAFYLSGGRSSHYFLKDDKIHGTVEIYFPCGDLKEKLVYSDGKRSGKGSILYPNGKTMIEYNYKEDNLEGEYVRYFPNGNIQFKKQFSKGLTTGEFVEYHSNGKVYAEGEFVNDNSNGLWKYYYSDGKPERKGMFKNDIAVGEWEFYGHDGTLSEKRNFDDKGKWQGKSTVFYKGRIQIVNNYENDVLIGFEYFDENGKLLGKFQGKGGNFSAKTFWGNGAIAGEGNYKNGRMDGKWVYYYPEGIRWREQTYRDGLIQGLSIEYFKTGAKKFETNFKDGNYDGYFQEYYLNGKTKQEGWFANDQRQQQWLLYYSNGNVETDYYYLNDELVENYDEYNIAGKRYASTTYDDHGYLVGMDAFNSSGESTMAIKRDGPKTVYESKFPNGKQRSTYNIKCGVYEGALTQRFPNGKIYYTYDFLNGRKTNKYESFSVFGKSTAQGQFSGGLETGHWKYFNSVGKIDSEGNYLDGERDSTWVFYYDNGMISSTAEYNNGKRDGISTYLDFEGNAFLQKKFELGHFISYRISNGGSYGDWVPVSKGYKIEAKYSTGTPLYTEEFADGLHNGTKRVYYPNGQVYSEYNFKNGDYEGPYSIYYRNGKVAESGQYSDNELMGTKKFFNDSGKLLLSEEFMNDYLNGKTTVYTNNTKVEYWFWGGLAEK